MRNKKIRIILDTNLWISFLITKRFVHIHSFSKSNKWYSDFEKFVELFGLNSVKNSIVGPYQTNGINVYFGWVC
ncbi:MAG: hypothetical protein V1781_06980 [Bacteroidota bacterium]